ncbi:t-SNARE [Dichotomocladium elegans]|nr:t-SNARE [Dichotomocladium elegans]
MNLIQKYQDMERTFSQKYRQQVARQIRIVNPDVTEDEIDAMMDSDEADQVFAQSLLKSNRTGKARDVLSEVQTRHDDIKRIERTLLELHQLFIDMQMLIEQQGQVLTEVEENAVTAASDIEKGVHHVDQAIKIAKATRTKKWCCFIIFIIIILVVAFCVWWFAFNHKGIGN